MFSKLIQRFLAYTDRLTMEAGARSCYRLMVEQDKRVMFSAFSLQVSTGEVDANGNTLKQADAMAMTIARGERAEDLDALVKQLILDVRSGMAFAGGDDFDYAQEIDFEGLSDKDRQNLQDGAGIAYELMRTKGSLFAPVTFKGETIEPMTIIYLRSPELVVELEKRLREADMLDEVLA